MDEILKLAPLEERIYRHRCVEGWSIVVPWVGYSLSALLKQVEPTSKARYVYFESYYDLNQMPEAKHAGIPLPYVEGLRLDEAMNPLVLLGVGMYGESPPPQDGAPVRLVAPWKYGFKSIKSLVKIRLAASQPQNTGNITNAHEYGFYSNVNPQVDHPRWSQATERRLGEVRRRPTLIFNGYADQVAHLYAGIKYECSSADSLLKIAESHGVDIPSNCRVGQCGTCATRVIEGEVEMETDEGLEPAMRAQGYRLLCVGRALGDVRLEA